MKEKTLINMKHDMGKLATGIHNCIKDLEVMRQVMAGLLQTIKNMPGYEEAIQKLKDADEKRKEEEAVKKMADLVDKELNE